MPKKEEYLKGFNIFIGLTFDKYILKNIQIDHYEIKKWNEYSYPTELTFKTLKNATQEDVYILIHLFEEYVKESKIIKTSYGNSYVCNFIYYVEKTEFLQDNNYKTVIIKCTGHAIKLTKYS